ncbi:MAG: hypothetical protein ACPL6D_14750 [Thermodesulfobacteriota bacterium]
MGEARGPSIEIPSYACLHEAFRRRQAKASEGYPPVAKSTVASSDDHMNNLL